MKKIYSLILLLTLSVTAFSQTYNITFQVDLTTTTGFTTPEVNGTFNNWCGSCFAMTDDNGDGIWQATTALAAGSYEYKFSYDNWNGQETLLQGMPCTVTNSGFTNRTLVVTGDATLPVVCFGSCSDCASTPGYYDVTFQVDMTNVTGYTTPEVNGTFNGWCGSCNPLSDTDGDNIWTVTITLPEGNYEYKYSYDNWTGQESLAAGSSCTITTDNFTNRTMTLDMDKVLDVVCWESCSACGQSSGPYNVTFEVDMNDVTFNYTTPEINGTFNNWCGACAPLADPDGDNVWSITLSLGAGAYSYKFSYDNWTGQEELAVGSSCVVTDSGFTNRYIDVSAPANVGPVCWQSCSTCITAVDEVSTSPVFTIYPNPVSDKILVRSEWKNPCTIAVMDMTGKKIREISTQNLMGAVIDVQDIASGSYFLVAQTSNGRWIQKFEKVN